MMFAESKGRDRMSGKKTAGEHESCSPEADEAKNRGAKKRHVSHDDMPSMFAPV